MRVATTIVAHRELFTCIYYVFVCTFIVHVYVIYNIYVCVCVRAFMRVPRASQ